ncbi:hypothetical protein BDZ94DRAFT_1303288 [Collybia nuda]|uniref:DNA replication regulator Sld3 C-terminal domain-containing protein n=1 Tax=Collybia nuda TaxID=64659 RepID=A0A9P5YIL6_9AGAR|nr:hypothetical protein BDZ94DRAFT_1303288 [Collybia nuda]
MLIALHHDLESSQRVGWTQTQEKTLAEYPFVREEETNEQYVARTYLQFLWLPESIMPLNVLVPSFLRVGPLAMPNETPHPLHEFLKPLLLTARSASNKYHVELPQILEDGGGAGEIEETMMWYALNHEQADDELWAQTSAAGEGPWVDATWRTKWIERMERREFQIQILLYMLKLSLPGPHPPPETPTKSRKRSRKEPPPPPPASDEECLEAFMDKLSMWQLVAGLERAEVKASTKNDERDWSQMFFGDIVEPRFKSQLPELCSLFRSKIFPNSPFSSGSASSLQTSPASSRAASPEIPKRPTSRAGSSRQTSPALSTASSKSRPLARSRSLSVTLALEQERERSVGLAASKKRVLNREISMSRVFKPKPKFTQEKKSIESKKRPAPDVLVRTKTKDEGITLVAATPVKSKARAKSTSHVTFGRGDSIEAGGQLLLPVALGEDDDEEMWDPPSSPDISFRRGTVKPSQMVDTPNKRPRIS